MDRGIGDQQIADAGPYVRALVVQRLEQIWRSCEPHIDGTGGKPDPRYIEAGIRVCDRLARLYRLDSPERADQDAITGTQTSYQDQARALLTELADRVNGTAP